MYGVYYHYYYVDFSRNIEIHNTLDKNKQIRSFKPREGTFYCGSLFLCKSCYIDLYDVIPFQFFPIINCETLTKGIPSWQMIIGFYGILCILAYLQYQKIIFFLLVIAIFISYYLVQNFTNYYSYCKCKHLKRIEFKYNDISFSAQ